MKKAKLYRFDNRLVWQGECCGISLLWDGYDKEYWWQNIATSKSKKRKRCINCGKIYEIDFVTGIFKELDMNEVLYDEVNEEFLKFYNSLTPKKQKILKEILIKFLEK